MAPRRRSSRLTRELDRLGDNLDRLAVAAFSRGPARAAEEIVVDLQEAGPVWTGEFSNSWRISTSDGRTTAGSGSPGMPQRISSPLVSGRGFAFDDVLYSIDNFSNHADVALDLIEGTFIDPGTEPLKDAVRGTRTSRYRGAVVESADGGNRRTAPLDWYSNYLRGGYINRRIRLELDRELGRVNL